MGISDLFGSGISIDSRDAEGDKQDLRAGRMLLEDARDELVRARAALAGGWQGSAAAQCDQLLEGFIRQINELIEGTATTAQMLDTIVDTYREADQALRGKMR